MVNLKVSSPFLAEPLALLKAEAWTPASCQRECFVSLRDLTSLFSV